MQFKRLLSAKIQRAAESFPAVVLSGARQVGKSTLLKELFPEHHYINLDLPSLAEMAEESPESFFSRHPAPLLIDEIQYAPKLFRHLKVEIDKKRHAMGRYILTGSQKFNLMKEVSESLAGRVAVIELETLSLAEISAQVPIDYLEVLSRGLYPELWRNPALNTQDFYSSYLATYLERDLRQILNVSSLRDFERFIRACAARSAQLLNYSDLGRDVGIKAETARQWLSVLQASSQISLLEPYFANIGKRIVKSPKLYWNDPGLWCFLMGLDKTSIEKSALIGPLWETLVYAELRKGLAISNTPETLFFYRDAQGLEADFLRVGSGKIDIIEAKWSESPDKRWADNLKKIGQHLSGDKINKIGELYLLCRSPNSYQAHGVQVISALDL